MKKQLIGFKRFRKEGDKLTLISQSIEKNIIDINRAEYVYGKDDQLLRIISGATSIEILSNKEGFINKAHVYTKGDYQYSIGYEYKQDKNITNYHCIVCRMYKIPKISITESDIINTPLYNIFKDLNPLIKEDNGNIPNVVKMGTLIREEDDKKELLDSDSILFVYPQNPNEDCIFEIAYYNDPIKLIEYFIKYIEIENVNCVNIRHSYNLPFAIKNNKGEMLYIDYDDKQQISNIFLFKDNVQVKSFYFVYSHTAVQCDLGKEKAFVTTDSYVSCYQLKNIITDNMIKREKELISSGTANGCALCKMTDEFKRIHENGEKHLVAKSKSNNHTILSVLLDSIDFQAKDPIITSGDSISTKIYNKNKDSVLYLEYAIDNSIRTIHLFKEGIYECSYKVEYFKNINKDHSVNEHAEIYKKYNVNINNILKTEEGCN